MIEVEGLNYIYPGAKARAVRDLSFKVNDGEVFGFLGPSGAGKSTTQKILIGLLVRFAGSVRIFGQPLAATGGYYERIGVSFELPNVYTKLTARENLAFFASLYSEKTAAPAALLEMVGLAGAADQRVATFSKGMKMRLGFGRALVGEPDLLFLDEPTSGQDPVNARRIMAIIREQQAKGRTVFLTTHDMVAATQLCDRVAFIVDGGIQIIDSPRQLMLEHGRQVVRVEYRQKGDVAACDFDLLSLGKNDEFLALLREERVETIHSQEATLADVFIEVTGRRLA